jgi:hypothetical protein
MEGRIALCYIDPINLSSSTKLTNAVSGPTDDKEQTL